MFLLAVNETVSAVGQAIVGAAHWLVLGVILILAAILIFSVLKHILVNTVLGLVGLAILKFGLGLAIPLSFPVIVITILFGLGGLGMLLVLMFFGINLG